MDLKGTRILLTGANGGIGAALAERFAARGAGLVLVGRDGGALESLVDRIGDAHGIAAHALAADLLDGASRDRVVDDARARLGGIDVLVSAAGTMSFRPFVDEDPAGLERLVRLNLVVPMAMTQRLLPEMIARRSGRIVNIGSTFGSIGFAWFTAYSASKFGLRGFSEALRRELDGTGVGVTHVAPRGVRTGFNSDAVYRMAAATGMHMDEPAWVAERIVEAIERDARDLGLGFPERFFARLNAVLPRLVDGGLRKQNRTTAQYARGG